MVNPRELYHQLTQELEAAGIPDAAFDVRCMFEQVSGRSLELLLLTDALSEAETAQIRCMMQRRMTGQPLQYILGEWEFYGLRMFVGEGVLIPRPDTETLVDTVLEFAKTLEKPQIADLCSGSGCIALALQENLPQAKVHAVEKSEAALSYLRKNAAHHRSAAEIIHADVLLPETAEKLGSLDIIVSNPPYLTDEEMQSLQTEVRHEPELALAGGTDGLYFYREITKIWKSSLKSGGVLAYEVGDKQAAQVAEILREHQFSDVQTVNDLAGIPRVVCGRKNFQNDQL